MTLTILASELSALDQNIEQLIEQIAQYRQQKKQLLAQAKLAQKAIDAIAIAKESLNSSAFEGLKNAIANFLGFSTIAPNLEIETVTVEAIEQEDKTANLVERPKVVAVENASNEMFAWQQTLSDRVATYFNLGKGVNHALYLAANNKNQLSGWGNSVADWMGGKSRLEIRTSKRMPYKYEAKLVGNISDDLVGFLTQFNFSKPLHGQVFSNLEDCPASSLTGQHIELACPTVLIGQKYQSTNATWQVIESVTDSEFGEVVARCACLSHSNKDYVGKSKRICLSDFINFELVGFMPTDTDAPDWHLERISKIDRHYKMYLALNDGTIARQAIGYVRYCPVNSHWYATNNNSAREIATAATKNEAALKLREYHIEHYRKPDYYNEATVER